MTLGHKKGSISFFIFLTVVLCIAVGWHLTLCLELKAQEGFQQPQPRFSVILARESCVLADKRENRGGACRVREEKEKKEKKNIRPGRGIIIFPLISSVWKSSHLSERQTEREYSLWYNLLPYEQRKTSLFYLSLSRAGFVNPFWTRDPPPRLSANKGTPKKNGNNYLYQ